MLHELLYYPQSKLQTILQSWPIYLGLHQMTVLSIPSKHKVNLPREKMVFIQLQTSLTRKTQKYTEIQENNYIYIIGTYPSLVSTTLIRFLVPRNVIFKGKSKNKSYPHASSAKVTTTLLPSRLKSSNTPREALYHSILREATNSFSKNQFWPSAKFLNF